MQKIKTALILFPVLLLFTLSCDKLDAPYATVKKIENDTTNPRKVLLEDYTGHKCTNCPTATKVAEVDEAQYKGRLIVLAVHAGYFATPDPSGNFTADYRTPEGTQWFTDFAFTGTPNGMVNRKDISGARVLPYGSWTNAVTSIINLPPDAVMEINNTWDAGNSTVTAIIDTKFKSALEGSYAITVCIVEDSIISAQKNLDTLVGPTPIIYNYVFNNMLRKVVNGAYGEQLTDIVDTTQIYQRTFTIPLQTGWVPKNCSVMAYITREDTKEIFQAEEKKIIQ